MADLLGATNRVAGYESIQNNRVPLPETKSDPRIQNAPDPTRINRADAKTERQGADSNAQTGALRYDSNFQAFLQQLRQAPDLARELGRIMVWLRSSVATPGLSQGIAQEMASLLGMLRLDREALLEFFTAQAQGGTRYGGPLFDLLRQAYQKMPGEGAREAILQFARKYADFSSLPHLTENFRRTLEQIAEYLPKSWRGTLTDMTARLENGLAAGNREENLRLLQGELLPYLSSYVEKSHNIGMVRTLIGMLSLNIARYENASEEGVLTAFRQLSGYGDILGSLNQLDNAALLRLMRENPFQEAVQKDTFTRLLSSLASRALRGELGVETREGFQEIIRAILINESVYMPLNHIMLPLDWNGKTLYSELWVDPNAEKDTRGNETGEREIRFLFKMDIQSLGAMEMVLNAGENQGVSIRILGPDAVGAHGKVVARDLEDILSDYGLTSRGIQVSKLRDPLTLTEVFPKLFEGKEGVDVKA